MKMTITLHSNLDENLLYEEEQRIYNRGVEMIKKAIDDFFNNYQLYLIKATKRGLRESKKIYVKLVEPGNMMLKKVFDGDNVLAEVEVTKNKFTFSVSVNDIFYTFEFIPLNKNKRQVSLLLKDMKKLYDEIEQLHKKYVAHHLSKNYLTTENNLMNLLW